ncbi:MAG: hypothetical protein HY255_12695 [Betaproteobacteria bacterium]|nr:hypothetical protein [Betaproteobacteria bacterium]
MEALSFASSYGTPVEIDACWSCQSIWFDNFESVALSPQSVIDLFRRIHDARDLPRRTLSMRCNCPRCDSVLANTRDMVKAGQFSYYRCPRDHGRLISFTQFLLEKSFVRALNPAEVSSLAAKVRQIRCSSCGAPIDLQKDTACTHCGSPISVLDDQAVEKALKDYEERAAHRIPASPQSAGSGYRPAPQPVSSGSWSAGDVVNGIVAAEVGADLVDLVCVGISSLFD